MITIYDKTKLYEKEILPKLLEIKKICELNDLPFFSCCAVKSEEEKTTYKYEGILTGSKGIELYDDKYRKHLCVANGFDVKTNILSNIEDDLSSYLED